MSDLRDDPEVVLNMGWIEESAPGFDALQFLARKNARDKGFYPLSHTVEMENPEVRIRMATHLALITSEVSEALEEMRKEAFDKTKFGEELADVLLRLCDVAEAAGVSLVDEALLKMAKNLSRPVKHGKVF